MERQTKKGLSCPKLLRAVGANSKKGRDFLNLVINKTCALGNSPVFLGSPRDFDRFGLACTVANTDAREVEPLSIHAYKQEGAQLVVGAALAEGTAGVELIVGAEKAATANPRTGAKLGSDVQGKLNRL